MPGIEVEKEQRLLWMKSLVSGAFAEALAQKVLLSAADAEECYFAALLARITLAPRFLTGYSAALDSAAKKSIRTWRGAGALVLNSIERGSCPKEKNKTYSIKELVVCAAVCAGELYQEQGEIARDAFVKRFKKEAAKLTSGTQALQKEILDKTLEYFDDVEKAAAEQLRSARSFFKHHGRRA
jgi:HD-GYP domain-containing protein (c-di-GMP phosphodiesterase class II)